MTEIKRSFYVLIAFVAILLLLPFFESTRVMGSTVGNFQMSQKIMTNVVVKATVMPDSDMVQKAENIRMISQVQVPAAEAVQSDETCERIGDISWSMYYDIAATVKEPVDISAAERDMLASALQLEVLGKYSRVDQFENPGLKYYELLAVAQIVRNRLESGMFPDNIEEILYDSHMTQKGMVYQFSTSPYIKSTKATELAYEAVDEVFSEGVCVLPDDFYYFCASWRESRFEINNRSVLRFLGDAGQYDKIVADATTFYAGVTMSENIRNGYVF